MTKKIINEAGYIQDINYNNASTFNEKYNLVKIREEDSRKVLIANRAKMFIYSIVVSLLILILILLIRKLS